jgi:hypothetical protein
VTREGGEGRRKALIRLLGRPVLLICWSLVLWGTLYGLLLLPALLAEGPTAVLQRVLGGRDLLGGVVNVTLAGVAAVVWLLVGVAAWGSRRSGR